MGFHDRRPRIEIEIPDLFQQHRLRDDASRIAHQYGQHRKFLSLQFDAGAGASGGSLTVAIADNGHVFCNEVPVGGADDKELGLLRAKLKQAIDLFGDKQPVVIHPQPRVRQQRVIDVLAACAAAGVKNLSFFANQ